MNSFYKPIKIGSLQLEGNLFLAPMAGYTDKIYRSMCLQMGCNLSYTEMVSAEGVFRNSQKTLELMERGEAEKYLAVQLFMPDSQTAEKCIENVLKYKPDLIDINCGCPVPKVTKTGCGSALMHKPAEIKKIVSVLVKGTGLPVTVKIRTGWDCQSMNYLECAQQAFEGGASALCMHARTKSQLYMPYAHWELLKDLKDHFFDQTIIGSGDLFTATDAKAMFEQTAVDAVAFARGSIGNPFIFEQTKALLNGDEPVEITKSQKVEKILEHLNGLCTIMSEKRACREMRKHVCAYLKGIPNSSKTRNLVTSADCIKDYEESLQLLN